MPRPRLRLALAALPSCVALLAGCAAGEAEEPRPAATAAAAADAAADAAPVLRTTPLPFHYPPALYARRVQADVTLRLYIDSLGAVHPESTSVAASSGHPALDSAAVAGARALHFAPARRRGRPVGAAVRFPILFRHPALAPAPGDSVSRSPS